MKKKDLQVTRTNNAVQTKNPTGPIKLPVLEDLVPQKKAQRVADTKYLWERPDIQALYANFHKKSN